ncbi:unnamed protein product [Microthlaspi erraticum]|uniref:Uncharacterized protein n=1 Tax=Microthlaspi erraticum TaxID=1685480 RepID=A0A6D2HDK9_9BRAS|nr:unnamed protein product [Microthlaspi erraticum]
MVTMNSQKRERTKLKGEYKESMIVIRSKVIGRRSVLIRLLSSSFYSSRISYDPPPRISPRAANDPVPTWSLIELELVFTSTGIARMAVNWLTRESLGGLEVFLLGLSGPGLQSWIKVMGPYGLDSRCGIWVQQ